jgi:hypothetical protein
LKALPSIAARVLLALLALAFTHDARARVEPPAPGTVSPRITARSWRGHPSIVAIRTLVRGHQVAMAQHRWRPDPTRRCRSAEHPLAAEAIAIRDEQKRIRVYVTSSGSDDSAYRLEHHYDDAGRLRFAFGRSGAVNGSTVEYRIYLDEWGRELWRDVRARGPGYTFLRPPDFPDAALVRDPVVAASVPLDCGR